VNDTVRIERLVDLPRAIVEDALVDPVLVEGWLHPTHLLEDFPDVVVAVTEVPGGARGWSTLVSVEIAAPDRRFEPALRLSWEARLDRLEDLLRGHPADWHALAAEEPAPARDTRAN
jgi:uncharacterized protein YndB with AHSA1/START domain